MLSEANRLFRVAVIETFFIPQLKSRGYKKTRVNHPALKTKGLTKDEHISVYFDVETGLDYPDGDEWVMVDFVLSPRVNPPDSLKNPDYFTRIPGVKGAPRWRHRELVRFRQGRVKRLEEALIFIDRKAGELDESLKQRSVPA